MHITQYVEHNGILCSYKKWMNFPYAALWMDLEIIIISDVSQTEKDSIIWKHLYMESWKTDTNELIYKTDSVSSKNNLMFTKGKTGGKGKNILGNWY